MKNTIEKSEYATKYVFRERGVTPPMFDVSNIVMWKHRMSMYLKTLGLHVFLTATKKSYLGNSKHIEANAQALEAL